MGRRVRSLLSRRSDCGFQQELQNLDLQEKEIRFDSQQSSHLNVANQRAEDQQLRTLLTESKRIVSYELAIFFAKGKSVVFKNFFDRDSSGDDFHNVL